MSMGDTCYPNSVPFTMDEFERHLYLFYHNSLNLLPRIHMNFKSSSVDPVQVKDFLNKIFGHNYVRRHKDFECCFDCQYPWKPIPKCKLYPNWKLYPFLKHILYVFHFAWLLGCSLAVDEQMIGFQCRHVDKMKISYNNKEGGFQADALCNREYTYVFLLRNECPPKVYTSMGFSPLHACVFYLFLTLRNKFLEVHLDNLYTSARFAHPSYTHHNCVEVPSTAAFTVPLQRKKERERK